MRLNSDEQTDLTKLVPPLPILDGDGFSKGVIARTRLVKWRYDVMHVIVWICLGLSLLVLVPWQTILSVIQQYTVTILMQSLQQVASLIESLQADFDQQIDFSQPVLVVTAVLIIFAVSIIGVLADD